MIVLPMLPLQERAQNMFQRLQTDELFEHFGKDSRHITLPTNIVIQEFTQLAQTTIDPNAQRLLGVAIGLFETIGGNGICVRIKDRYNVAIRGVTQELSDRPSLQELIAAVISRSGLEIDLFGSEPIIRIQVANPNEAVLRQVKEIVSNIPAHAKVALVKGILEIIDGQLNQVMDVP